MPTASAFRTIFSQCNIFVGPAGFSGTSATGFFYTSGNTGLSTIGQLSRVQSADLSIAFNRTDINEFGILQRIDSEILASPSFTLNFSYFPTDGMNENILGFNAKGNASFISGLLTKASDSKNYFVAFAPNGTDDDGYTPFTNRDVASIGNGFLSNYSINAAVNQPVRADVTVEGLNVVFFTGASGQTPAIDPASSNRIAGVNWQLPVGDPYTGQNTISIIKPGDIVMSIPNAAGFGSQISGAFSAQLQSFTLSVPISREKILRLGSPFSVSEEINFPVNCTLSIQGLQTNLQPAGFDSLLCNDVPYNISILMRQPSCQGTGLAAVNLQFNNAFITSQRIGQTVGGDATLSVDYTTQLAGPTSLAGVVFSGYF